MPLIFIVILIFSAHGFLNAQKSELQEAMEAAAHTNKFLYVGDAGITDLIKSLNLLKNIQEVTLGRIDDEKLKQIVQNVSWFKELKNLYLTDNTITDEGLVALQVMKNLEKLGLIRSTKMNGDGFKYLSSLPKLKNFSIWQSAISQGNGLKYMSNLESLDVSQTNFFGVGLKELKNFKNLKFLRARFSNLDETSVKKIRVFLPNLEIDALPKMPITGRRPWRE